MRIKRILPVFGFSVMIFLGGACSTSSGGRAPTPRPSPEEEPSVSAEEGSKKISSGPWSFSYSTGEYRYEIVTEAEVAQFPDTATFRSVPATTQEAIIAVTDTGIVVIDPPAPSSLKCDSNSALFTRAQALLPQLPSHLAVGTTWNDSTTTNGCRGTIPTTTTLVRKFTVVGDTTYDAVPALHIVRTETIVAKGEGNEGPHRILLSATGSGTADIYFDVASGRFLGLTGLQTTQVGITASGRTSEFLQKVNERIVLLP